VSDNLTPSRPHRAVHRRRIRPVALLLATAAIGIGLTLPAHADGVASTFVAEARVASDGLLRVKQTITFSGAAPAELSQKFETRENLVGGRQYVRRLTEVSASAKGAAVAPAIHEESRFTTVSVPTNGATEIVMNYTVSGAAVTVDNGVAVRWGLLQGLSAQVTEFSATVQVPAQFSYVKCTAGSPNSTVPCSFAAGGTEAAQVPTFRDGPRGIGEVVTVDIGFAAGSVAANEEIDHVWSLGRAFSAEPLPLALALGLLVLGGLGLLAMHRRAGADASPGGQMLKAGEFIPTGAGQSEFRVVGDIRPGHVGTVVDERVDPIDVTASLIDLAVRGHLLIQEQPRASEFARAEWVLTRTATADELRPFERAMLNGIAPEGGSVKVSELSGRIHDSIAAVQNELYDEVVDKGWFERRPDSTRNRWMRLAVAGLAVAVLITLVLAAFTVFGLVGLALIALALGLIFVAQEMPARTAQGAALLAGLGALRSDLMSQPTNQMPPGGELREISELLPYAVVLGGADRWLDAIVAADADDHADETDLPWYHGPANWHLRDLPDSLRNFITTVSGSLFTR
jgi:hypothetical protein